MDWSKKALHALGTGDLTLDEGTFEMLFVSGIAVDLGDAGHEFEDDLTGTGTITHRETLSNVTWANRVLDADNFTITDPGGGTKGEWAVLIKQGGGGASTNRIVVAEDIQDVTWDGVNDQFNFNAQGIARIGSA